MSEAPGLISLARIQHSRLFAVAGLLAYLFARPAWSHAEWLVWLGYPMVILAVAGRTVCSLYIGGRKSQAIVALGPYSVVRNPLYVFSFIGMVGASFFTGMLTLTVALVLFFVLYYPGVVRREEKVLEERFPVEFGEYRRQVPRWLPNFSLWQSPESIEIRPATVLTTMRDAVWFFAVWPVTDFVEYLHAAGLLPAYYSLL